MNGNFARVTRCAGTTSEEGGSYSSNDMVCACAHGASHTSPAATNDDLRPTASIVRISQEKLSQSYAGDRVDAPDPHGRIVRNWWDFRAPQRAGPLARKMVFGTSRSSSEAFHACHRGAFRSAAAFLDDVPGRLARTANSRDSRVDGPVGRFAPA